MPIIVTFIIFAVAAGALLLFRQLNEPSPLESAANHATFPIFDIKTLPEGYEIDEASISLTSQALLIVAKNNKDKTIIITQTPVPKKFDYDSFYDDRFIGIQDAQSIYGRGKMELLDNAMTGSLVTDSTWIIIKAPEGFPAKDMLQIIASIKPTR